MDNYLRKNHILFQYLQGARAEITFGFGETWGPKKEFIVCACGSRYIRDSALCSKKHTRSKNHIKYLKEKEELELLELEREFEELTETYTEKQSINNPIIKDINLKRNTHTINYTNERNKRNKTGVKGVYPSKNGYKSQIIHQGKTYHLGTFKTIEEATLARHKKANELLEKLEDFV